MNLAPSILGQTAVTKLQESARSAVLTVGSDNITRSQLARVDCYNFHAARLLTSVLKALGVKSLRQVYDEIPPAALAVPMFFASKAAPRTARLTTPMPRGS